MTLYLDSSALMKLVQREPESNALRRYLRRLPDEARTTSALSRVEVVRAVGDGGPAAIALARRQLARVAHINLDREVLDAAATLAPGMALRSLDAIHLASAAVIGSSLRAVITYDDRMRAAGASIGFVIEAPA